MVFISDSVDISIVEILFMETTICQSGNRSLFTFFIYFCYVAYYLLSMSHELAYIITLVILLKISGLHFEII